MSEKERDREVLARLLAGESMSREEAEAFMESVLDGTLAPEALAAALATMRLRGETVEEVEGCLDSLMRRVVRVPWSGSGPLVDTCGTGGDRLGTFNISTAVALLVAACGVRVAKHGNRSVSSQSGSADVLERAGVRLISDPDRLARAIDEIGFAFLFAPNHHPALGRVAPVRKALGVMTIFNLLGPLANPMPLTHQYVGVTRPDAMRTYGEILHRARRTAVVVCGREGADEALPGGPFRAVWVVPEATAPYESVEHPANWGIGDFHLGAFAGGDAVANALTLAELLAGRGPVPLQEAISLNAGLVLHLCGREPTPEDGIRLAEQVLARGEAAAVLRRYVEFTSQ